MNGKKEKKKQIKKYYRNYVYYYKNKLINALKCIFIAEVASCRHEQNNKLRYPIKG